MSPSRKIESDKLIIRQVGVLCLVAGAIECMSRQQVGVLYLVAGVIECMSSQPAIRGVIKEWSVEQKSHVGRRIS